MCGITAIFSRQPTDQLAPRVDRLLTAVAHRGPDGRGAVYGAGSEVTSRPGAANDWALGHVRLAIIDLSEAGLQPMSRPASQLWVTYNGEIYNYLELRQELQEAGLQFATSTDTEVLLAAYQHWGVDCLSRLTGMFAFVLVDLQRRQVLVARDRLGIKPLYLWKSPEQLVVVSEPKQLLAVPEYSPIANRQMLVDYLTQGLLAHEPDACCFQGVTPLPAGSRLSWPLGQLPDLQRFERWWNPSLETRPQEWPAAVERTGSTFRQAVRWRLRSDVPVGTCLSGGVDSSSIVGVCQRELGTAMKTFSICNQVAALDETPYIDAVNAHCGAESVKEFVTVDRLMAELDDFVFAQDEPVYSASQYAEYQLMRRVHQAGIKVMLNGQGGDEALCGYRKYFYFYLRERVGAGDLSGAAVHLWQGLRHGDRQLFQLWQGTRYLPKWKTRDDYDRLLRPAWGTLRRNAWSARMGGHPKLRDHQWADLAHWSLPVLLRYQDRNSMAFGIESRVPLVDHNFLEHCLTVPESFFFRRGMTKRLLVDALGDSLPPLVRDRRTKLGFDTPQAVWMRGQLGVLLEARVRQSQRLAEIVNRQVALDWFARMRTDPRSRDHFRLFRLACLAVWLERFQVNV